MTIKQDLLSKRVELLQKANELMAQIDSMKDEPVKRTGRIRSADELGVGDNYFYVATESAYLCAFNGNPTDLDAIESGLAYYDKESAQRAFDLRQLMTRMDNAAAGSGERDWSDDYVKYCIAFDAVEKKLVVQNCYLMKTVGAIYFATEETAQAFLDSLSDYERELLSEGV